MLTLPCWRAESGRVLRSGRVGSSRVDTVSCSYREALVIDVLLIIERRYDVDVDFVAVVVTCIFLLQPPQQLPESGT